MIGYIGKIFCFICKGSGWKVVHKQGDPVPGTENSDFVKTTYASTLLTTCDCCIIQSSSALIVAEPPWAKAIS